MGEPGSTPTGFEFFRRLARRLGVPARHAEDLAQDALLRGLEADLRVELGEARASYGATIVLNQARNHVRNERRRGEVLTSFDDQDFRAECPTPEEMLRRQQREALIRYLINQVDPRYRDVLIKHAIEEVPLVEIASELGLNPKTVRTQYLRALEDLAAAVERWRARQRSRGWDDAPCVPFAFDLRGREAWLSWLNAITVHVASHYHERAQHRREELVDLIEVLDPAPDAAAVMERGNIRTRTIDAVNELDPELRFVLVAHDLNGVSMAKAAEDAGLPLSTLYKRRTKAIDALRDTIRLSGLAS
ncbi:sigma-70 family RNA polymerase sigma factor [Sorangium sp. So ce429]